MKRLISYILLLSVALVGILPTRVSAAENPEYDNLYSSSDYSLSVDLFAFSVYQGERFEFCELDLWGDYYTDWVSDPYFDHVDENLIFDVSYFVQNSGFNPLFGEKGDKITFESSFSVVLGQEPFPPDAEVYISVSTWDAEYNLVHLPSYGLTWWIDSNFNLCIKYNGILPSDSYSGLKLEVSMNVNEIWDLNTFTLPMTIHAPSFGYIGVSEYLPTLEEEQIEISHNIFENVVQILRNLVSFPSKVVNGIGQWFTELFEDISVLPSKISLAFSNFFNDILGKLSLIIDSLDSDKGKLDSFLDGETDAFGNALDDLNNLNKPSLDEIMPDIDNLIPSDEDNYLTRIFGAFWAFDSIKSMLILSIVFALVGYTFFGKR